VMDRAISAWRAAHPVETKLDSAAVLVPADRCSAGFANCANVIVNAGLLAVVLDRPLLPIYEDTIHPWVGVLRPPAAATVPAMPATTAEDVLMLDLSPIFVGKNSVAYRHLACHNMSESFIVVRNAVNWVMYRLASNTALSLAAQTLTLTLTLTLISCSPRKLVLERSSLLGPTRLGQWLVCCGRMDWGRQRGARSSLPRGALSPLVCTRDTTSLLAVGEILMATHGPQMGAAAAAATARRIPREGRLRMAVATNQSTFIGDFSLVHGLRYIRIESRVQTEVCRSAGHALSTWR